MCKNGDKSTFCGVSDVINDIKESLTKSPDYLYDGSIGLEDDPADYLRSIKAVRLA